MPYFLPDCGPILLEDVSSMIGLQAALRFNGGGHINHSIFWQVWCFYVSMLSLFLSTYFCPISFFCGGAFCPFFVFRRFFVDQHGCSEPFTFTHVGQNLCPGGSGEPTGALAAAIQKDFGSFEAMKNQLSTASVAVQVSCSFFHHSCVYK